MTVRHALEICKQLDAINGKTISTSNIKEALSYFRDFKLVIQNAKQCIILFRFNIRIYLYLDTKAYRTERQITRWELEIIAPFTPATT